MLIQQNKGAKHYISIGHGHLNLLVTPSLSAGSKGIHIKKRHCFFCSLCGEGGQRLGDMAPPFVSFLVSPVLPNITFSRIIVTQWSLKWCIIKKDCFHYKIIWILKLYLYIMLFECSGMGFTKQRNKWIQIFTIYLIRGFTSVFSLLIGKPQKKLCS